jgi:hypothetical protein
MVGAPGLDGVCRAPPHEVRQKEAKSTNISFLQKPFTLDQFKSSMNAQLAEL